MELFLPISVFIAGLVTALLPCTYPMILGFFSFLLSKTQPIRKNLITLFWFFIGFSVTYAFFGSIAGLFGQFSEITLFFNNLKPILTTIGGIFFIIIGLVLFNAISLPNKLQKIHSIKIPKKFSVHSWWSTTFIGFIFATGWSPCIGPILGGILLLAGTSGSVLSGALLLIIFSFGLLVPLVVLTFIYSYASEKLTIGTRFTSYAQVIGGLLFITVGILFITGDIFSLSLYTPYEFFDRYI